MNKGIFCLYSVLVLRPISARRASSPQHLSNLVRPFLFSSDPFLRVSFEFSRNFTFTLLFNGRRNPAAQLLTFLRQQFLTSSYTRPTEFILAATLNVSRKEFSLKLPHTQLTAELIYIIRALATAVLGNTKKISAERDY